jgi:hypothetical protein
MYIVGFLWEVKKILYFSYLYVFYQLCKFSAFLTVQICKVADADADSSTVSANRIRLKIKQCCGYGSGIRCLFLHLDPGSGMGKNSGSGSEIRIRDKQPRSYFPIAEKQFFGLKYLNSFMWIRDPGWKKFGSGIKKIRIWDRG